MAQIPAPTPGEHTNRTPMPPRTQRRRRSSGSASTTWVPMSPTVRAARARCPCHTRAISERQVR